MLDCITEDTLLNFLDGGLSSTSRIDLCRHIRHCCACYDVVAAAARGRFDSRQSLETTSETTLRALVLTWSACSGLHELAPTWEPPRQIEEYRLEELLGSGSAGRVYRGHDLRLDRAVAIKFLAALEPAPDACERFLIEARAVARLHHPNVAACYRIGEVDGRPYLVSEYVTGVSLDHLPKPVPWQKVLHIGIQLARGLGAVHHHGVLHRDIKPANAMLSENNEAKLVDFGLAKLVIRETAASRPIKGSSEITPRGEFLSFTFGVPDHAQDTTPASPTGPGGIVGTPAFMAPELWRGEEATARSDVYSLAALLYQLCSGSPPHQAPTLETLRHTALVNEVPPLGQHLQVHPRLAGVLARCLKRSAAERLACGSDLAAVLEQIAKVQSSGPWVRRTMMSLGGAALLVGVTVAPWRTYHQHSGAIDPRSSSEAVPHLRDLPSAPAVGIPESRLSLPSYAKHRTPAERTINRKARIVTPIRETPAPAARPAAPIALRPADKEEESSKLAGFEFEQ